MFGAEFDPQPFHLDEDGDGPEVGRNNDLWACLEQRADGDSLSDGGVRIATTPRGRARR